MLYRITLDLAFYDLDPAMDIWDKALDAVAQAVNINPGQENEERGFLKLVECYHDEDPSRPCLERRIHEIL